MAHIAIAGAGAAGLFAAGSALAAGHSVTLIEPNECPGKKLLITGKGRCNLTNHCDEATFLANIRHNARFLYSAVTALPPAKLMVLFEQQLGVPLKTERGRRVFPASDAAADVVAALCRYASGAIRVRGRVQALLVAEGRAAGFALEDGQKITADAVLVATGGMSYPTTGSTGDGYALARQAGHTITPLRPSLVALVERGGTAKTLMGLSLRNVGLRLLQGERCVFREQGEVLFTHFGLSGPLALSASAYVEQQSAHRYAVALDLKPGLNEEKLDARLQRDFAEAARRSAAHSLDKLLPQKLRGVVLAKAGIDPALPVNQITKERRRRLVALLKDFRFEIAGLGDLNHAVITAGGVDTKQVNPKTMESKLLSGLYFAGEVLDVDGYTGGYNLHIAWSTAYAAAKALDSL